MKDFIIGALVLLAIAKFIVYLSLPSYPKIADNVNVDDLGKQIVKIVENNSRDMQFEALAENRRIPVEYSLAIKESAEKFKQCKNDTKCIINVYENFMDDWTSTTTRKKFRCFYLIHHLGVIGELLCQNLEFLL